MSPIETVRVEMVWLDAKKREDRILADMVAQWGKTPLFQLNLKGIPA